MSEQETTREPTAEEMEVVEYADYQRVRDEVTYGYEGLYIHEYEFEDGEEKTIDYDWLVEQGYLNRAGHKRYYIGDKGYWLLHPDGGAS